MKRFWVATPVDLAERRGTRRGQRWWTRWLRARGRDPALDRLHDRSVAVLRELEGQAVLDGELAAVEVRLFGDAAARPHWSRIPAWGRSVAVVGGVGLVLLVARRPVGEGVSAEFAPRGRDSAPLALDVACSLEERVETAVDRVWSSASRGCSTGSRLTFSIFSDDDRIVTLFGLQPDGRVRYYAPTPAHPDGVATVANDWRPAGFGVDVARNHSAGPLTVFALAGDRALTVVELDELASWLPDTDPPRDWHQGLPLPSRLCATPCRSVAATIHLRNHP